MSVLGAMFSGVSGLAAQSTAISMISDNISNSNTNGFKGTTPGFSTLVTSSGTSTYSSGGVSVSTGHSLNQQGLVQSTGVNTDFAIAGNGMFVVNEKIDQTGAYLYTRAGSFKQDSSGNFLVNGYALMGWPLDSQNRLPGDPGNANTTANSLLQSLVPINLQKINSVTAATTNLAIGLNLKADETIFKGSGETIAIPVTALTNTGINTKDIIAPENSGGNILNVGDSLTLTPSSTGVASTYTYGGIAKSGAIGGGILGATTYAQPFTGAAAGDHFTVQTLSGPVTFTYTPNAPDPSKGQFNSLQSLVLAINQTSGLYSRLDPTNSYLVMSPIDATQAMTITDVTGTFKAALGLVSTVAAANRFSSINGLNALMTATPGVATSVTSNALSFYAKSPLGTLTVAAAGSVGPPVSTAASVLSTLGLGAISPSSFGPAYDPTGGLASNMSVNSATVSPQFVQTTRVYDALGVGHDIRVGFIKTDVNTWAVEIYAVNKSDIVTNRTDSQLAAGTVVFNGDGTLSSVSNSLAQPISITWADKSLVSSITMNWGTAGAVAGTNGATQIGKADGLQQIAGTYNLNFETQDGIAPGQLSSFTVGEDGIISANFNNGGSKAIFKLPLAYFGNYNGLTLQGGNVYAMSADSGNYVLKQANVSGMGKIESAALEQANVDLSDQLTKMIVAQRGYQASSKIIRTANEMLDDLNRIIQ